MHAGAHSQRRVRIRVPLTVSPVCTRKSRGTGANNSIQPAAVQYILDSVLLALEANPNRKFIYVEQVGG